MRRELGAAPLALLVAILAGSPLLGCATSRSAVESVRGWFGGSPGAEARPRAFYSASAGVPVRQSPDVTSKAVGTLARHEGVLRYQVEEGFAYVKAEKSGITGWVRERDLIERLPATTQPRAKPVPAQRVPDQSQPVGTPAEPAVLPAEEAVEPDEPADPEQEPAPPPEKSVFDPY